MNNTQSLHRWAALAGLLLTTQLVHATDYSWTNAAGGTFSDAGNWDPNATPGTADQAFFALGGSTYTVDFTANAATSNLLLTGSGQVVTFNLQGNTYLVDINNAASGTYRARIGTGATDSVTLIIDGGTLDAHRNQTYLGLSVGPNSTLIVTNGGRFMSASGSFADTSKVIIDGVGSSALINHHIMNAFGTTTFDFTVQNGATAYFRSSGGQQSGDVLINGGTLTNEALLTWSAGSVTITNGGTLFSPGQLMFGQQVGPGSTVTVGDTSGLGSNLLSVQTLVLEENGTPVRNNIHLVVNGNGILRLRGSAHPLSSGIDAQVADGSILSLVNGNVEMQTNAIMGIRDVGAAPGKGLLRGSGTFTKLNSGLNFTVRNDGGDIDIGDTSGLAGSGSTIGKISIFDGDLEQINGGTTFFDFDATTSGVADFIAISDGVATLGGTLDFDAIGAPNPNAYSRWEFLLADDIIYTASDNIAALMAGFGIAPNQYFYGVVDYGTQRMLILEIPEPSTAALLLGFGGLLVARRRHRTQSAK